MRKSIVSFLFLVIACSASAQYETNVYFDFDSFHLSNASKRILDSVVTNRKISTIDIHGHCDQLGSNSYNYVLSDKRARTVAAYLIVQGFEAGKIKSINAIGEDKPAVANTDSASRALNRRVTILVQHSTVDTIAVEPESVPLTPAPDTPSVSPKKEKLVDEISDTATKAGQHLVLKNINFYAGTHRLLPSAFPALRELLEAMQKIPTLVIEIEGHICCQDNERDALDIDTGEPFLSLNRARAIFEFLVRNDIDRWRMTYKGYGHKFPIYKPEYTEAQRTANRRVEIKILKK